VIQELMERPVVRAAAKRVRSRLIEEHKELTERSGASQTEGEVIADPSDIEEIHRRIEDWEAKEAQDLAGGSEGVWVPNDPIAGLIQSVVEDYFFESGIVPEPQSSKATPRHVAVSSVHLPSAALSWLTGKAKNGGKSRKVHCSTSDGQAESPSPRG
jgi:hypothetical protein